MFPQYGRKHYLQWHKREIDPRLIEWARLGWYTTTGLCLKKRCMLWLEWYNEKDMFLSPGGPRAYYRYQNEGTTGYNVQMAHWEQGLKGWMENGHKLNIYMIQCLTGHGRYSQKQEYLQKFGYDEPSTCPKCACVNENAKHVFFSCPRYRCPWDWDNLDAKDELNRIWKIWLAWLNSFFQAFHFRAQLLQLTSSNIEMVFSIWHIDKWKNPFKFLLHVLCSVPYSRHIILVFIYLLYLWSIINM